MRFKVRIFFLHVKGPRRKSFVSYETLYKPRVCGTNSLSFLNTEKILKLFNDCHLPKRNRIQNVS